VPLKSRTASFTVNPPQLAQQIPISNQKPIINLQHFDMLVARLVVEMVKFLREAAIGVY